MSAPTLETLRLVMRDWRDDDVWPLAAILSDPETVRYLFGGAPLSFEGAQSALARRRGHWEKDGFGFFAVELKETGSLIGWAGVQVADHFPQLLPAVEVGWTLGREHWGKGLATEAGGRSLRYGFEALALERIIGLYHPDNQRSENVMRKLGMTRAGATVDPTDGDPTMIRAITRQEWFEREEAA